MMSLVLLGDGYNGLYSSEFSDIFRNGKQDTRNGKTAIDNFCQFVKCSWFLTINIPSSCSICQHLITITLVEFSVKHYTEVISDITNIITYHYVFMTSLRFNAMMSSGFLHTACSNDPLASPWKAFNNKGI